MLRSLAAVLDAAHAREVPTTASSRRTCSSTRALRAAARSCTDFRPSLARSMVPTQEGYVLSRAVAGARAASAGRPGGTRRGHLLRCAGLLLRAHGPLVLAFLPESGGHPGRSSASSAGAAPRPRPHGPRSSASLSPLCSTAPSRARWRTIRASASAPRRARGHAQRLPRRPRSGWASTLALSSSVNEAVAPAPPAVAVTAASAPAPCCRPAIPRSWCPRRFHPRRSRRTRAVFTFAAAGASPQPPRPFYRRARRTGAVPSARARPHPSKRHSRADGGQHRAPVAVGQGGLPDGASLVYCSSGARPARGTSWTARTRRSRAPAPRQALPRRLPRAVGRARSARASPQRAGRRRDPERRAPDRRRRLDRRRRAATDATVKISAQARRLRERSPSTAR